MNNHSFLNFRGNLESLLKYHKSYDELARYLDIPNSTLKSWINGTRCPSLKTIDKMANKVGCYSAEFIIENSCIENKNIHSNFSHLLFVKNLNILFLKKQCFTMPHKLSLLDNVVTDYALQSYLRKQNYKTPTLSKLDLIANALNIPTYILLSEETK